MNFYRRLFRVGGALTAAVLLYMGTRSQGAAVILNRDQGICVTQASNKVPYSDRDSLSSDLFRIEKQTETASAGTETKETEQTDTSGNENNDSSEDDNLGNGDGNPSEEDKPGSGDGSPDDDKKGSGGTEVSSAETELDVESESSLGETESETATWVVAETAASDGFSDLSETGTLYMYDGINTYQIFAPRLLVPAFHALPEMLGDMIRDYEGSWSIYVKDLKTSISVTINDQPQDSASLIKLYIAGAVLEEIRDGDLEETEFIDQLLSEMVSISDNEAANELVRYLSDEHDHQDGLKTVNEFIENHGFTNTHQYNGLEDPNLWYGDEVNVTSVTDCGRFLEEVYNGDLVNHLASRQVEGYLLDQDITWKIPAGIPSEITTANKTGEKDNTQNDVSIVYTPYRDYILCVMATDITDEDTAVENIRDVSRVVYEFFQETDTPETLAEYSSAETEIEAAQEEE